LKSLTTIDISDCTNRIPALLSIPHLLLSSTTDCETLGQAEASPDCELMKNECQNLSTDVGKMNKNNTSIID